MVCCCQVETWGFRMPSVAEPLNEADTPPVDPALNEINATLHVLLFWNLSSASVLSSIFIDPSSISLQSSALSHKQRRGGTHIS